MKYEAKYLPVEGEIKAGGKHICLSNGIICDTTEENDFYVNNDKHKKVKLFLCSRDAPENWDNPHVDYWDGIKEENRYRVIGEISPDALGYVKEGDEFEEGWVKQISDYNSGKHIIFCQIKGPCGRFH